MKKVFVILLLIIAIIAATVAFFMNKPKENVPEKIQDNQQIENVAEEPNELFGEYYQIANKLMENMTIEEKVGQLFYARYPSTSVNTEIKELNPGGYILFGKDFMYQTSQSILNKINENQKNSKIKMFMGVDEEGGTVTRVSGYSTFRSSKFQSPQQLWNQGQMEKILEDSTEKSTLLKSIGLNTNLAPVVDIPTYTSSFMYARSFGKSAEETADYARQLIKRMKEDNIISVMKHFPGYGDNVDTHTGIAVDTREYETFQNSDFLPFIAGIEEGAPMIMVNHNIINCMDSELPASLSKNVHDILRNEFNYSGIIITDDLAMNAVKKYVNNGQAAVQAILAGNDMIISSDFRNQRNEVLDAINNGIISEEIINTAVRRILSCKLAYGIIEE